jgi:hypothetical protein
MGSSETPKTKFDSRRSISNAQLYQTMSELISLREKVAQAELAGHVPGRPKDPRDEVATSIASRSTET